jgi:hypothetical protein
VTDEGSGVSLKDGVVTRTTTIRQCGGWSLALGSGVVVYNGPGSVASRHRHDATQLVWSCGVPFHLDLGGTELAARAAVVPARRKHLWPQLVNATRR